MSFVIELSLLKIRPSWSLMSVRGRKNLVVKDIKGSLATPSGRPVALEVLQNV